MTALFIMGGAFIGVVYALAISVFGERGRAMDPLIRACLRVLLGCLVLLALLYVAPLFLAPLLP